MKKFLISIVTVIFFSSINITALAQEKIFSDLDVTHKNFQAINYLQQNGVINGYPDGTFKPENDVNRVELLKILIEGNGIEIKESSLPFSDLYENAWYLPYLKTAYYHGWVQGYGDNTYKPGNAVSNVEALKIILEANEVDLTKISPETSFSDVKKDDWFAPYVYYAKEQKLIDNLSLFFPGENYSRADISEIIFRIEQSKIPNNEAELDNEEQTSNEQNDQITSENENSTVNSQENDNSQFVPFYEKTIAKNYFNNLELSSEIPNRFYKNEIYIFEGIIEDKNVNSIAAVIENIDTKEQDFYKAKIIDQTFSIPVYFNDSGNFNLSFIPGADGTNKAALISVLDAIPEPEIFNQSPPSRTNNFQIDFDSSKTFISLPDNENTITKVIFEQNGQKVTYLNRQNIDKLPIRYIDFADFSEGEVQYRTDIALLDSEFPLKLSSSYRSNTPKTFNATNHHFSTILNDKINAYIPDKLSDTSQNIYIKGQTLEPFRINAYVITPDGNTTELKLQSNGKKEEYYSQALISSNQEFSFFFDPSEEGAHIIEINDKEGLAIVNHPIYVGEKIPLLPDFYDLNYRQLYVGNKNIDVLQEKWLLLINKERAAFGLNPVSMRNDLNQLAQAHANDMKKNSYFSHINLQDQTPNDRRIAAGISTPVAENIAQDISIESAHFGLMRSAGHRVNILNPDFTVVGLGIAEEEGYLITVQEFSTDEITEEDINSYIEDIFDSINDTRNSMGLNSLGMEPNLNLVADDLATRIIVSGAMTDADLVDAKAKYGISGNSVAKAGLGSNWTDLKDSIINDPETTWNIWNKLGISIREELGILYVTIFYHQS